MKPDSAHNWQHLMQLSQKGDPNAYQQLLGEIYPQIFGFIQRRVPATDEAEDVTQEALMAIHKARASYDPKRSFESWMWTIVRYKLIDSYRRHEKQWARHSDVTIDSLQANIKADNPHSRGSMALERIEKLPQSLKQALSLTIVKGLSTQEAAQTLGITEASLRKRVSRAYAHLRKTVEEDVG